MSASIWAPGASVSANNSVRSEAFIATLGQTNFNLTAFSYTVGTGSLYVFVGGAAQRPYIDFTETRTMSFRLTTGAPADAIVFAIGFVEVV